VHYASTKIPIHSYTLLLPPPLLLGLLDYYYTVGLHVETIALDLCMTVLFNLRQTKQSQLLKKYFSVYYKQFAVYLLIK